jgi:hypothetical protein
MIRKLDKSFFYKFISVVTIFVFLAVTVGPQFAVALPVTSARAVFGRLAPGNAESVVITFVSPTGIQAGTSDDIILTFSADFTLAAEAAANFDIGLGDSGTCSTATYTDEGVHLAAPDASNWQVDVTGNVITLDPDTDSSLTAGFCVRIEMGTAATTGGTGAVDTVVNGAIDDNDTIVITGGFGDTGTITVDIIDDDLVNISATVNQSITFDLDVGTAGSEDTGTPYNVALGTVTVTDTRVSGATDSVNRIMMDLNTNATGGAVVTVRNTNGANGLVSTSVPADNINSADGAMIDGTENYGLCVISVTQTTGTLAKASPYDTGSCAADTETNDIQGLTTTGENIINTSGAPIAAGRAQIAVNAAISGVTVAHSDYTDTLTFIATATF